MMNNKKELRKFGLLVGGVFVLLFGIFLPWLKTKPSPAWAWILGLTLIFLGLAWPRVLGPIHQVWMKIGHVLGWVNSRIILGIVFYLIITPFGFLMRCCGSNPLKDKKTYLNAQSLRTKSELKNNMEVPY